MNERMMDNHIAPSFRQSGEAELKAAISDLIANLDEVVAYVRRIVSVLHETAAAR